MEKLIYKQYFNSNTQKFLVLMKLGPCIIPKLSLNSSDSDSEYSYKLYSYKQQFVTLCCMFCLTEKRSVEYPSIGRSWPGILELADFLLLQVKARVTDKYQVNFSF